jgi:hypothetical protein
MPKVSYLLDKAWQRESARLDAVEAFLDPGIFALLDVSVSPAAGIASNWARAAARSQIGSRGAPARRAA